jgi:hypothetical protein
MIDWITLGSDVLWILGLTIALATLSYVSWESSKNSEKFTTQLKRAPVQLCLNLAGTFFSLCLAVTSTVLLQVVFWLLLSALFLMNGIWLGYNLLQDTSTPPT